MRPSGLFDRATASLRDAEMTLANREEAIVHNLRLWSIVLSALGDPNNTLPSMTRAAVTSLARSAQQELAKPSPDIKFLMAVNDAASTSLGSHP